MAASNLLQAGAPMFFQQYGFRVRSDIGSSEMAVTFPAALFYHINYSRIHDIFRHETTPGSSKNSPLTL